MKVAIMQPYIFPYIGYFQLINAVDKFIVYDDVNFIKQGWINRNNILVNNNVTLFTIPLENVSSFSKINEVNIASKLFDKWKFKFFKSIELSYKKAPYYIITNEILLETFNSNQKRISDICVNALKMVSDYLGIKTIIIDSPEVYANEYLKGEDRIIDICKIDSAKTYINAIGGMNIYSKENFALNNIELKFIKSQPIEYRQFNDNFVPWLSIVDVLMFNSKDEIKIMLNNYELV